MAPLSLKPRAGGPAVLTQLHSPPSIVAQNGAAGSDELNAWIGHAAGGQPMSFLLSAGPVVQHSHTGQSVAKACQAAQSQSSPHGKSVRLTARVRAPGVSNARDVGENLRPCEWIRPDVDHNLRLHTRPSQLRT